MKEKHEGLIFGTWPAIEALKANKEVEKILIQKGLKTEQFSELMQLIKSNEIPYQYVPQVKLNKITKKNHQGVIAFVSPIDFQNIEDILPGIYERGETPLLLILDRITDVRNFGAICRSAECAGVHAVIIPKKGAAQIGADAMKTSAGALSRIPVCRHHNLKNTITFIKNSGLQIFGCSEKANKTIYQEDLTPPTAIIMGSEEDGVSPEYLKLATGSILIPMIGNTASLNVSVATGIVLFECLRQRFH